MQGALSRFDGMIVLESSTVRINASCDSMFSCIRESILTILRTYVQDYARRAIARRIKGGMTQKKTEVKLAVYFMGVESNARQDLADFNKSIIGYEPIRMVEPIFTGWFSTPFALKTLL